jgi:hypothetical protein
MHPVDHGSGWRLLRSSGREECSENARRYRPMPRFALKEVSIQWRMGFVHTHCRRSI